MIQDTRVQDINDKPQRDGKYVLYWMQESMRTRYNYGLEYAIEKANELGLPPLVCFGVTDAYPEANARHYLFLLQGFRDVEKNLAKRGIKFVVKFGPQQNAAIHYGKDAALIVCDRGYLRHQIAWCNEAADTVDCKMVQVESDVVVPVDEASSKHEYGARTIRPKIQRLWDKYLVPLEPTPVKHPSLGLKVSGDVDVSDPDKLLKRFDKLDFSVAPVSQFFEGGEDAAASRLADFANRKLDGYAEGRNEPSSDRHSYMSMYLHFGHVSPVELALQVRGENAPAADRDSYLEELIVRRELSMNYCNFVPNYDSYDALPDWAKKTLADHAADERPVVYSLEELETASTGDVYWNAAQMQMVATGFMHNYMRMYWGKKILEWTASPREAYDRVMYLNNKYFLC
ncbi:MAG TPA: deoxyribodipyrimidine photo-lyase, partial [Tepidisphaeraceae bacterium]